MTGKKITILVVDDDDGIRRLLRNILELNGFAVLLANNGESAIKVFDDHKPDLLLLDLGLPDMDGVEVCKQVRSNWQLPIIMVTARGREHDMVNGLNSGADDYVVKPFSEPELLARIKAIVRRSHFPESIVQAPLTYGNLVIDFAANTITVKGKPVELTATEYKLLTFLARNAGRVLTHSQILLRIWGEEYRDESYLVRTTVARLRRKIGDEEREGNSYIITRPGIGYTFQHPDN